MSNNKPERYSYGYAKATYAPFKKLEKEFDQHLINDEYYIIRFDGKGMTADYKIKSCPINDLFFNTTKETFYTFCKGNEQIIFGYSFSDEISILIKGSDKNGDYNRIEKLLSLLASTLSVLFYQIANKNNLKIKSLPIFDARIIPLKEKDIGKYFCARQAFAIDKYLSQLKGEYEIDYKLHTSKDIIKELQKQNIKYEEIPVEYKYGLVFFNGSEQKSFEFYNKRNKLRDFTFSSDKK